MLLVTKNNKRLTILFTILIALFSTGIVIAHQCHTDSNSQVAKQHIYSENGSITTSVTQAMKFTSNTERLIDTGCATLFIVVLLFGKKFLDLRAPRFRLSSFMALVRNSVAVHRPQVLELSLSRSQLGVIRI